MQEEQPRAIRHEYQAAGVEGFYRRRGSAYRNPHEPQIGRSLEIAARDWRLDLTHVLDLAAGSGEVTLALREVGATSIDGIDPYTHAAYEQRTRTPATRETFEQIAAGGLAGKHYTLIVCSFALHLVEPSRLPRLAFELSRIGQSLLILTPHKRPHLDPRWGWSLEREMVLHRVRTRLYRLTSPEHIAASPSAST